jgi:hypothetical protein
VVHSLVVVISDPTTNELECAVWIIFESPPSIAEYHPQDLLLNPPATVEKFPYTQLPYPPPIVE